MDTTFSDTFHQPEVLQHHELLLILKNRGVEPEKCEELSKAELVEKYYAIVCPLPQRKYRSNRTGRKMTRNQIQILKKKRSYSEISVEDNSERYTIATSNGNKGDESVSEMPKKGLVNEFSFLQSSGDRIKPPPIVIDPNKKIVKLGESMSRQINVEEQHKICINRNVSNSSNHKPSNESIVKTSELDHIVINSKFNKRNISAKSQSKSDLHLVCQNTSSTAGRVKLKRSSFTAAHEENTASDNVKNLNDNSNTVLTGKTFNERNDKAVTLDTSTEARSPKQRQINLINSTLQTRAICDVENPFPGQRKLTYPLSPLVKIQSDLKPQKKAEDKEVGVVTKKFKSNKISWP